MSFLLHRLLLPGLLVFAVAANAYLLFALVQVLRFRKRLARADISSNPNPRPPVTVLKPICGLDPGLDDNLRSFCEQDYPDYQIIFGVRNASDPAIPILRRIIDAYPERDIALVISDRVHGENLKVSNLINMFPSARHDILVIADSDMRVERDMLALVTAPFTDPTVGAVTCLYRGTPDAHFASTLAAMNINEWFLPSVLVALAFQELHFCFGATMAVRRETLTAIDGFEVLVPLLADDYRLGDLAHRHGYKVRLADCVVECVLSEPTLGSLFAHELRWARTVRTCQPAGYAFSFISSSALTLAIILMTTPWHSAGQVLFSVALALRVVLYFAIRPITQQQGLASLWLIPVRDLLCSVVWAASFFGRRVRWRQQEFTIQNGGELASRETGT